MLPYLLHLMSCNARTLTTETNETIRGIDSVVFNIVGDYCNVDIPSVKINATNMTDRPVFIDGFSVCKYTGSAWMNTIDGEISQPFLKKNIHKPIPQKSNIEIDIDYTVDSIIEYSGLYYVTIQYRTGNRYETMEGGCWFQTLPIASWKDENGKKNFMVGHKRNICPPDSVLRAIKHNSDSIKATRPTASTASPAS